MLYKDNYVPWSSRLLRYAKSKPNGKLIYNSIINGPYVRRMIPELDDPDREVPVAKTFHEQTDDELTKKEVKKIEADDQAIQVILMGLPEKTSMLYEYIKNYKNIVKNGQARIRESEEYKKKPKIQSRSQKSQTHSQSGQIMVNKSQQDPQ
ncbi:hypothetical protein Tco_1216647 [Tanacetum coccineum]